MAKRVGGWLRRLWRDESGVVMLETALVFPLQLFITLALVQMALVWSAANVVHYAAFQGARTAMVHIKGGEVTRETRRRAYGAVHAITSALSNPAYPGAPNTVRLRTLHHDYYMKETPLRGLDVFVGYDVAPGLRPTAPDDLVVTAAVRLYFPLTVPVAGGIIGRFVKGNVLHRSGGQGGIRYIPMEQVVSLPKPWPG